MLSGYCSLPQRTTCRLQHDASHGEAGARLQETRGERAGNSQVRLSLHSLTIFIYNPGIPLGCQIQEICVLRFYILLIWFLIRLEDMNLIRFEFGVMISMWFCYVCDMVWVLVWIWFWNVLDVNLIII